MVKATVVCKSGDLNRKRLIQLVSLSASEALIPNKKHQEASKSYGVKKHKLPSTSHFFHALISVETVTADHVFSESTSLRLMRIRETTTRGKHIKEQQSAPLPVFLHLLPSPFLYFLQTWCHQRDFTFTLLTLQFLCSYCKRTQGFFWFRSLVLLIRCKKHQQDWRVVSVEFFSRIVRKEGFPPPQSLLQLNQRNIQ